MRRALVAGGFFGLLVALWGLAAASGRWSPVLLPSPWEVEQYLEEATLDG